MAELQVLEGRKVIRNINISSAAGSPLTRSVMVDNSTQNAIPSRDISIALIPKLLQAKQKGNKS